MRNRTLQDKSTGDDDLWEPLFMHMNPVSLRLTPSLEPDIRCARWRRCLSVCAYRIGWTSYSGGCSSASSMAVMPTDQMSQRSL
ncbi:hypothetical protein EYF80_041816 [Liparis tanakae]|uniref:Uncharacterized protein n=1 Tax=Liparis tanakae TaxID=230148 RepID=A0A4Z2G527_9TELE|nr:hypothetical protein EYF80_041816 [Liparis tanakae]